MNDSENAPLKARPAWEADFPHERVEATHVSRREFAKFLCLVSGGLCAGTAFVAVKDRLLPPHRIVGEHPVCRVADVPAGGTFSFTVPGSHTPYVLIHLESGEWRAFEQKCTHLACAVFYKPGTGKNRVPLSQRLVRRANRGGDPGSPAPTIAAAEAVILRGEDILSPSSPPAPPEVMSTFRRAQSQAHPNKTNTLFVGIISVLILIVSLQVWLLTAVLNTALGGDLSIVWPAFYASLALFLGGAGLLRFMPQPLRLALVPEKAEAFANVALAWRTLAISATSLALSFAVWFMWSAIALKLSAAVFAISPQQRFWLTAAPVLLGSLLRIPYGLIVSRFGSRNSYTVVTLLLLVPCIGTGMALRDPATSFGTLLFWASLTGIAGANFATSMANRHALVSQAAPGVGSRHQWTWKSRGDARPVHHTRHCGSRCLRWTFRRAPDTRAGKWNHTARLAGKCRLCVDSGNPDLCGCPVVWDEKLSAAGEVHRIAACRRKTKTYLDPFGALLPDIRCVCRHGSLPFRSSSTRVFANAPGGVPNPLLYSPFAVLVATLTRPLGGWLADRWSAGGVTAASIAAIAVCGFSLSQFLEPDAFTGFFWTIMILCAAAGLGNGSIFKIIPSVMGAEAGAVIGFVSCLGALGGFFPPLLLGWCMHHLGSPAWAYTTMAIFALCCFALNWAHYWRRTSPTRC
jgi:nitrate/nitrite transporter NarK